VFWVLGAHGLSWFPVTKPCNGGWWDGVEFVAEFLGAGILIEAFEWVKWISWEKPSSAIAPVEQAEVMSSGGGLLFVPQNLLWNLVFIGASFGLFKWAGSPDPCEAAIFSWRHLLGCVSFAYAVLGMGDLANLPMFLSRSR